MGRSSQPPYLYGPPVRYSVIGTENEFNPKAVTEASRAPPKKKAKQDGPLVHQINRHPDSYIQAPYGQLGVKPMSRFTKPVVKWTRWVQLFFRILQLIGAIGLLVCVICIRGTQTSEGWIIRVPAAVDILVGLYAAYHLMRAAKCRPPASSASYHFFALILDAGLIPFYTFTAIMAHNNFLEPAGTNGRWRTLFKVAESTEKILKTTWLVSTATGGMHVISLFLDFFLVVMFRKIANMPPDMNPLEDNLTSRRKKRKHKHKNSAITVTTTTSIEDEKKRFSELSGSTADVRTVRGSHAYDPLLPPGQHQRDSRPVSFFQTRNDSSTDFSPHTPATARLSRADLPSQLHTSGTSARNSVVDLHRHSISAHARSRAQTMHTARSSTATDAAPARYRDSGIAIVDPAYDDYQPSSSPERDAHRVSSRPPRPLQSDNWFVVADDSDAETGDLAESYHGGRPASSSGPATAAAMSPTDDLPLSPLGMNPPTPRPHGGSSSQSNSPTRQQRPGIARVPTSVSTVSGVSELSQSTFAPERSGTKGRYYGDLRTAMMGIRGGAPSPVEQQHQHQQRGYAQRGAERSPRVVSRSGVDVDGADLGLGQGRRRDVSGKVAEEGRGGWWSGGLVQRKVSGVA